MALLYCFLVPTPPRVLTDCFLALCKANLALSMHTILCRYNQAELRTHFLKSLQEGKLEPFPSQAVRAGRPVGKEQVGLYCTCQLPDDGEEPMAMCSKCGEWFHESCERIIPICIQGERPAMVLHSL